MMQKGERGKCFYCPIILYLRLVFNGLFPEYIGISHFYGVNHRRWHLAQKVVSFFDTNIL